MTDFTDILDRFNCISLAETDRIAPLLKRMDTKFVLSFDRLPGILDACMSQYSILDIEGCRISRYETSYYDTADMGFYHAHHAGRVNRQKIRIRTYVETGSQFLEIKRHQKKGRTVKVRKLMTGSDISPLNYLLDPIFLSAGHLPLDPLQLSVVVQYKRITLVNPVSKERLTIDLNVGFGIGTTTIQLPGFVVAELKQESRGPSFFKELMKTEGIRMGSISKYCLGVICLYENVKKNRFKAGFKRVQEIIKNENAAGAV